MNPTRMLERSFAYSARFWIAVQNLGFVSAVRVFSSIRNGSKLQSIYALNRKVFYRGAADRGVMAHFFYPQTRIIDSATHPVRVIVDAGANIGIETIRMRHFHPQAKILAIEADPGNFAVLTKNADEKVEALHCGVWSRETGLRVLPGDTNQGFSVRPVKSGETADIEAVPMSTLLERLGGEIDILKMDIEGSEFEVFSSDTGWADHVKAFIIECPDNDHPGATQKIFHTLGHLPLDAFVSGENLVLIRRDTGWKVESTPYL